MTAVDWGSCFTIASKMGNRGKVVECILELERHEQHTVTRTREKRCEDEEEYGGEMRGGEEAMRRRTGGRLRRSVMGRNWSAQQQAPRWCLSRLVALFLTCSTRSTTPRRKERGNDAAKLDGRSGTSSPGMDGISARHPGRIKRGWVPVSQCFQLNCLTVRWGMVSSR